MRTVWKALGAGINQAHNGYLEQYLNLGYVGVGFIVGIIAAALLNIRKQLDSDSAAGLLRLCFVVVAILYNYTEASFYGINNMWLLLLLGCLDVSGTAVQARRGSPVERSAVPRKLTAVSGRLVGHPKHAL